MTPPPKARRVRTVALVVVAIAAIAVVGLVALMRTSPLWGAVGMFDDARRAEAFRTMDATFPAQRIAPGDDPWPFERAERALPERYRFAGEERPVEAFLEATETTGLLVARDGVIVHESYRRGYAARDRIASFSVAKVFVTTLVGIAHERGHIASLDDALERYVPELASGGYAGVTVRQALTMTSGIAWDEAYDDPGSDVMGVPIQVYGLRRSVPTLLARLDRARAPGLARAYVSSDALVLGLVVSRATGLPLGAFLEEALWEPAGMADEARWNTDLAGTALAHAFLNATLRDYARFGRLMLAGGARDGRQVVPRTWVASALRPGEAERADAEPDAFGADFDFGYHWWLPSDGEGDALAIGIYGQYLYLHPGLGVVIVKSSTDAGYAGREAEHLAVLRAIARGAGSEPGATRPRRVATTARRAPRSPRRRLGA